MGRKRLDLTKQQFGFLTAIEPDKNNKNKWICECKCGNIKSVLTADLKRGHTKSCGCFQKQQTSLHSLIDLTGQFFGELEVLERDLNFQGHGVSARWICKCHKCGNIKSILGDSLKNKKIISCGCLKSKGEYKIASLLKEYNINFITEYKFSDHLNRRYDFALLNKNNEVVRLIEFDGLQHYYEPQAEHWVKSSTLEEIKQRDLEKNLIAKKYNIPLIRIPYWKLETLNILQLLDETYLV